MTTERAAPTAGPYRLVEDDPCLPICPAKGHHCLALCNPPAPYAPPESPAERMANARLFRAAPEMLEVLREAFDVRGRHALLRDGTAIVRTEWIERARAVIAKGEGR